MNVQIFKQQANSNLKRKANG